MNLYWGDLHNHCGISYGFGSLENALTMAERHLDFCCVTGHAMWPDMYERTADTQFVVDFHRQGFRKLYDGWNTVRDTINRYNTEKFVTFQSYEMHSSKWGDHHLVSPDADLPLIYRNSPGELVRDCGCRAIAVPHHIGYTPGYRGIDWEGFDPDISPVVEVYSKHGCAMRADGPFPYYHDMGPLDPHNTVAEGLRRGYRFSFVGSTDHHAGFPGSYGDGLAGVWAEEKTRDSIFEAVRKGHTYAVTGDRIVCRMRVNDALMGDEVTADKRNIEISAEGDAPLAAIILRKNGRIAASKIFDPAADVPGKSGRYKLRLEMGWSNSEELYHWEGQLRVEEGEIAHLQPYWRGRNALSPRYKEADAADRTNALRNSFQFDGHCAVFECDTLRNPTTLHPQTSAFVFEVNGDARTKIVLDLNGFHHEMPLAELLEYGFTNHVKPWHSNAYQMHTAYTAQACSGTLCLTDMPESDRDVYQAEAIQVNGCRAFISPVFVRS